MKIRLAILPVFAVALAACTTATVSSNPLQARWAGKSAGDFFAAYGPPVADRAGAGGTSLYSWRRSFGGGKSCMVELTVNKDYRIKTIQAVSDRVDPKGGPTLCETTLDAG